MLCKLCDPSYRYIRELDFARFHYYALTGLYEAIKKSKGGAVQGASSVRYRRTIPIFSSYRIETKVKQSYEGFKYFKH